MVKTKRSRVTIRLPVAPDTLQKWVTARLRRPRPSTFMKLALLIDELRGLALNPKHSLPQHFEVSNGWAERRVSRVTLSNGESVRPLKLLTKLGLIESVSPHRADIAPRAITYRFKVDGFKRCEIECSVNVLSKFKKAKVRKLTETDSRIGWIEQSLKRASIPQPAIDTLKRSNKHRANAIRYEQDPYSVWAVRGVYIEHRARYLPKSARRRLVYDGGDPATRLDISSAHPVVLPWLLEDTVRSAFKEGKLSERKLDARLAEIEELRRKLSGSEFYSGYLAGERRKKSKKGFLRSLNGAEDPDAIQVARELRSSFPLLAALIRNRRSKGKREFSDELQGRVTTIILEVIEKCMETGIPCIPVTDELIIPFKHRLEVLDWFLETIWNRTGVRAKVDDLRAE